MSAQIVAMLAEFDHRYPEHSVETRHFLDQIEACAREIQALRAEIRGATAAIDTLIATKPASEELARAFAARKQLIRQCSTAQMCESAVLAQLTAFLDTLSHKTVKTGLLEQCAT